MGTQKVLVTGGGSGIGRATAVAVLEAGGRVVVSGRRREPLEELARAWPDRAFALPVDLANATARSGLVARARDWLGGLDGLVQAAGVVQHQLPGAIAEVSMREQLEVDLVAPLRLCEQALETLEPGGGVVLVASTLALRPVVTSAVYSAAKAGLLALLPVFAQAGAAKRVRFNAVTPGVVDTDLVAPERKPGLTALHPLGRLGTAEEVAAAILHLLAAPWTTGTSFVVDGGLLTRE